MKLIGYVDDVKKIGKVQIRKWGYIDLYYNEVDEIAAKEVIKEYEAKGYSLQNTDYEPVKGYELCSQLLSPMNIKTKKLKQP